MDLAKHLFEQSVIMNMAASEHISIGREQGLREAKAAMEALRTVVAAYDMVKDKHPLPTVLVAACEQAKRVIG